MRKESMEQAQNSASDQQASQAGDKESDSWLSAARRGHLKCLLQMGHMEAVMGQVDGWSLSCSGNARVSINSRYSASQSLVASRH